MNNYINNKFYKKDVKINFSPLRERLREGVKATQKNIN